MEQINLFSGTADPQTDEDMLEVIRDAVADRVEKHWGDPSWIRLKHNKGGSSVYFLKADRLLARVVILKKVRGLEIKGTYGRCIPSSVPAEAHYVRIKNALGETDEHLDFFRIDLSHGWTPGMTEMMKNIIDRVFDTLATDFGCCASYVDCSNARRCLHDKDELYLNCFYRKNLYKGVVYYGDNPTVRP